MKWTSEESWFDSKRKQAIFLLSKANIPALWGPLFPIQYCKYSWGFVAGAKAVRMWSREPNHSLLSNGGVLKTIRSFGLR